MRSILILSALVGAVTAQTVTQIAVPMIDMDGISVSMVGKDSHHTTYAINCVQSSDEDDDDNGEDYPLEDEDDDNGDDDDCPISAGATLIVGGSSVDVLYSDSIEVVSVGCNSNYVCNAYASAYGTVESFTTALDTSYDVFTYPITMTGDAGQATIAAAPTLATAGATGAAISTPSSAAESRTLSPASSSAAVATSTSSSGASAIETGSSSVASSGSSSPSASESSSPTASHNAGVAQATGSHWALGGAAVMALALL